MVLAALHRYRETGRLLPPVILNSIFIVAAFVLSVMSVGISLEIELAWHQYFLYIPLIAILAAVPVTPGGVGVMEQLFLYFFSAAGDPSKILAMALLYRLVLLLCGLPGAVIFLISDKISRQDMAAGLQNIEGKMPETRFLGSVGDP